MDRKTKRLLLLVICCSVTCVILGGTTSWAESNMCLQGRITNECLKQSPINKTIEGMSTGLLAGAGAAFGAAWHLRHQD